MLKTISNLGKVLSRDEQKTIQGGLSDPNGTCAVLLTGADGSSIVLRGNKADITAFGGNGGGNQWCCDSCASATWL